MAEPTAHIESARERDAGLVSRLVLQALAVICAALSEAVGPLDQAPAAHRRRVWAASAQGERFDAWGNFGRRVSESSNHRDVRNGSSHVGTGDMSDV